jgi:hypothetical protein
LASSSPSSSSKSSKAAPVIENVPKVVVTLGDNAKIDGGKLAAFVAKDPAHIRLTPQMKLVYTPDAKEWAKLGEQHVALCRDVVRRIVEAGAR